MWAMSNLAACGHDFVKAIVSYQPLMSRVLILAQNQIQSLMTEALYVIVNCVNMGSKIDQREIF